MTFPFYHKVVSKFIYVANKEYFWWTLFGLLFLPLAALVFFNHPSADDYCYVVDVFNRGFWAAQLSSYHNWTGRYTASFLLSASPILYDSFFGYQLVNLLLLILTAIAGLNFVKTILNKKSIDISVVAVSLAVLFLYLVSMPSLTEGFYWLAGAITYQLGNIATLMLVTIILNLRKQYSPMKVLAAIGLCVFICGCNETGMLEWVYILCALMAFEYASTGSIPKYYYILFVVSLISAAFIVFAPGNAIRSGNFQGEKNIFKAMLLAGEVGFSRMQEWLQNIVIVIILFLPFLKQAETTPNDQRKVTPFILALYPLFIVGILIVGYFPAFWSIGFEPPNRTVNVLYWIFCFSCLHYTVLWIIYIKQKSSVFIVVPPFVLWVLVFIIFRDLAPINNLRTATMDLVSGRARLYDQEMKARYVEMEKNRGEDVVLKPFTVIPKSIFFVDIEPEQPKDWKNVCTSDYFHLKSLNLTKSTE